MEGLFYHPAIGVTCILHFPILLNRLRQTQSKGFIQKTQRKTLYHLSTLPLQNRSIHRRIHHHKQFHSLDGLPSPVQT